MRRPPTASHAVSFALSTSSSSTSATPTTDHGQSNFARVRKMRLAFTPTGTVNCAVLTTSSSVSP